MHEFRDKIVFESKALVAPIFDQFMNTFEPFQMEFSFPMPKLHVQTIELVLLFLA